MATELTIARPYARAAFEHALATDALVHWEKFLKLLSVVMQDKDVLVRVNHPDATKENVIKFFLQVAGNSSPATANNFLQVLISNKRLTILPQIYNLFEKLKADHEQAEKVEIISAKPLSAAETQKLVQAVSRRLNKKIDITTTIDESLIGGAIVKAGDLVIDGSIKGRLQKVMDTLVA